MLKQNWCISTMWNLIYFATQHVFCTSQCLCCRVNLTPPQKKKKKITHGPLLIENIHQYLFMTFWATRTGSKYWNELVITTIRTWTYHRAFRCCKHIMSESTKIVYLWCTTASRRVRKRERECLCVCVCVWVRMSWRVGLAECHAAGSYHRTNYVLSFALLRSPSFFFSVPLSFSPSPSQAPIFSICLILIMQTCLFV